MKKEYLHNLLFEVEINHLCWVCDVTDRNRDAHTKCTPSSVHENQITNIMELHSPNPEKDIEFIARHPQVNRVVVLMKGPQWLMARVDSKYDAMTLKSLHESNVTLLESPVTRDGVDSELLLAPSHKEMHDLLGKWRDQEGFFDVKLRSKRYLEPDDTLNLSVFDKSGFCDLNSAKDMLTKKQMDVFQLACDHGYYDVPKRVSISVLAEKYGVSLPTYAEHLQKAESKLMPILLKMLRKA